MHFKTREAGKKSKEEQLKQQETNQLGINDNVWTANGALTFKYNKVDSKSNDSPAAGAGGKGGVATPNEPQLAAAVRNERQSVVGKLRVDQRTTSDEITTAKPQARLPDSLQQPMAEEAISKQVFGNTYANAQNRTTAANVPQMAQQTIVSQIAIPAPTTDAPKAETDKNIPEPAKLRPAGRVSVPVMLQAGVNVLHYKKVKGGAVLQLSLQRETDWKARSFHALWIAAILAIMTVVHRRTSKE